MSSKNNPSGQKDFLKECLNSINVDSSVAEFKQAFCSVCANKECTRSQWADSQWIQRMLQQEDALQNPVFLDPEVAKEYKKISNQDFITISQEVMKSYGGWVDIKKDGSVVHHADPPTENKSSSKIDQNISSLKRGGNETSEDEVGDDAEANTPIEDSNIEPEQVEEPEENKPTLFEEEESSPTKDKKPKTKKRKKTKNTPEPQGGIILGPKGEKTKKNKPSVLANKEDKWKAPDKEKSSDGKLKVRIGDGKVVDD